METIRYKAGEALHWLDSGSERLRAESWRKAKSVFQREGARSVVRDVKEAAGALFGAGSAAVAELQQKQIETSQYVLDSEGFNIVSLSGSRRVRYDEMKRIQLDGERCLITLTRGSVKITPFAYIVSGKIKVPIGWSRNDVEVPYDLLIDELAARSGLEVDVD